MTILVTISQAEPAAPAAAEEGSAEPQPEEPAKVEEAPAAEESPAAEPTKETETVPVEEAPAAPAEPAAESAPAETPAAEAEAPKEEKVWMIRRHCAFISDAVSGRGKEGCQGYQS